MEMTSQQVLLLLASILGGGLGVNLFAQVLKKLFKLKADSVIHFMVITVAIVSAGAQYVLTLKGKLPPQILGVSATAIYGFSQATFKTTRLVSSFLSDVKAAKPIIEAQKASKSAVAAPASTSVTTPLGTTGSTEFPL